jgi:hypothetical protein
MVTQTQIWIITATFPHTEDAQAAVREMQQRGFAEQDISVLYTDAGHSIRAGLLGGAVWGGVLGAFFGLIFPPIGLLIAAGPIAGVLASGAALGAAGALTVGALDGLIAGLVQLGLPREIATGMGEYVHKGDTLVIAHASSSEQAEEAKRVLAAHRPRAEAAPNTSGVISTPPA